MVTLFGVSKTMYTTDRGQTYALLLICSVFVNKMHLSANLLRLALMPDPDAVTVSAEVCNKLHRLESIIC